MEWAALLEGNLHPSTVDTGHGFLYLSLFTDLSETTEGNWIE